MAQTSPGNGAATDITTLRADLDSLRENLAELTQTLRRTGRDGTAAAAEEVRHVSDKAGRAVKAGADQLSRIVQERPALACGIAVGIGALIGAAFLRRR